MAELHVIGEICGGTEFGSKSAFCKWALKHGQNWEVIEGHDAGQTQVDTGVDVNEHVWSHPIDIHLVCRAISGWPKLHLQVWEMDKFGRTDILGYGMCFIPAAPGVHTLEVATWVPSGSGAEEARAFFVGGRPRLRMEEIVHEQGERFRLRAASAGVVHLRLAVITKDFAVNGIDTGTAKQEEREVEAQG
ncbi:unnamed protein product [Pedinophyceae sp. YPF-701]|nr:unnamed protein product [Pedinophyceae sp. YPF-701]